MKCRHASATGVFSRSSTPTSRRTSSTGSSNGHRPRARRKAR
jgi:hypothetical protein